MGVYTSDLPFPDAVVKLKKSVQHDSKSAFTLQAQRWAAEGAREKDNNEASLSPLRCHFLAWDSKALRGYVHPPPSCRRPPRAGARRAFAATNLRVLQAETAQPELADLAYCRPHEIKASTVKSDPIKDRLAAACELKFGASPGNPAAAAAATAAPSGPPVVPASQPAYTTAAAVQSCGAGALIQAANRTQAGGQSSSRPAPWTGGKAVYTTLYEKSKDTSATAWTADERQQWASTDWSQSDSQAGSWAASTARASTWSADDSRPTQHRGRAQGRGTSAHTRQVPQASSGAAPVRTCDGSRQLAAFPEVANLPQVPTLLNGMHFVTVAKVVTDKDASFSEVWLKVHEPCGMKASTMIGVCSGASSRKNSRYAAHLCLSICTLNNVGLAAPASSK